MWTFMKIAGLTWDFHEAVVPILSGIPLKCCHLVWLQHAMFH